MVHYQISVKYGNTKGERQIDMNYSLELYTEYTDELICNAVGTIHGTDYRPLIDLI